jgi:hypothetical protein
VEHYNAVHRTESCPQHSLGMLFCKRLDDPHHESISCFFTELANDGIQGGMLIVRA